MKKHLLILLSFTALVLSGCAQDPKPIEFVRELPQQAFPETVVAGNYSGITHVIKVRSRASTFSTSI